jgi:hypothetical protein
MLTQQLQSSVRKMKNEQKQYTHLGQMMMMMTISLGHFVSNYSEFIRKITLNIIRNLQVSLLVKLTASFNDSVLFPEVI